MKKLYEVCLAAFVAFSAFAEDVSKAPEPDWDRICFAITNSCIREEHSGEVIADMSHGNMRQTILKGGRGGKGSRRCPSERGGMTAPPASPERGKHARKTPKNLLASRKAAVLYL